MSNRFRRLTDLFVKGRVLELPHRNDGAPSGYLWIQVINSYERDEALSDAQVARARLVLALKEDGEERLKIEARMAERGRDAMIQELADLRVQEKMPDFAEAMRSEAEWKERMEIFIRTDDEQNAVPPEPAELRTQAKMNAEILEELAKREDTERAFLVRKYTRMDDEEFIGEWFDLVIDRRGSARATAEYRLTEVWYATRWCEAERTDDGDLDHSRCDGHRNRVFDTKADARAADDHLIDMIRDILADLNFGGQDPKDSGRATSSSDSPPTPSEPGESTPSTSSETPPAAPGTSPQPSATP